MTTISDRPLASESCYSAPMTPYDSSKERCASIMSCILEGSKRESVWGEQAIRPIFSSLFTAVLRTVLLCARSNLEIQ